MDESLRKVGGVCSALFGISYVLVALTFFALPQAQRLGNAGDLATFLPSVAVNPTFTRLLNGELLLGALFAIGAVLAIMESVRPASEGWARWTGSLALLGFAVTAIGQIRSLALGDQIAAAYVNADASGKAVIAATGNTSLDPQGWLQFGAVGVWIATTSILILRTRALPRAFGYLGLAVAVLWFLAVAGSVLRVPELVAVAAGLGGVVAAPIWYIGIGVVLYRARGPGIAAGTA